MMLDIFNCLCFGVVFIVAAYGLKQPKWITKGVLVARSLITILLCYFQHKMLSGKDPVIEKMAYFKLVLHYRSLIFLIYM